METPHYYYYYSCNYTQTNSPKDICHAHHHQWSIIFHQFVCIFTLSGSQLATLHHMHVEENVRSTTFLGWLSVGRHLLYFSSGMMTRPPHFVTRVYITSCGNPRTKPADTQMYLSWCFSNKTHGRLPSRTRRKVQSHQ